MSNDWIELTVYQGFPVGPGQIMRDYRCTNPLARKPCFSGSPNIPAPRFSCREPGMLFLNQTNKDRILLQNRPLVRDIGS